MTAEIAILNKSSIALAADSAVTIGSATGQQKVYNAANKLFMMSATEPVGLMIYGNATFLRTPWEVVIKEYRKNLGARSFDHVKDYATDFLSYLEHTEIFTQADQDFYFSVAIGGLFMELRSSIDERVKLELSQKGSFTKSLLGNIIDNKIDDLTKAVGDAPSLDNNTDDESKALRKAFQNRIGEIIENVFQELPLSSSQRQKLQSLAITSVTKRPSISSLTSGVVVAGYGNREVFPSLHSFHLGGILGNRLRYYADSPIKIDHDNPAAVIPLAQSEMVHAYMSGIETRYQESLQGILKGVMSSLSEQLSQLVISVMKQDESRDIPKAFGGLCDKVLAEFWDKMKEYSYKAQIGPTLEAIAHLERDELALLAESLVNLTSLKRKVSMDVESVGGPIDVALISKGDGFVWIKRKHYFTPDRNPHFMARYYRQVTLSEGDDDEEK